MCCHEQSAGGTKNTPGTDLKHPAGGTCNTAAHYGGSAPRPLCPPSLYIAFALLGLLVVPGCPSLPCMLVMPSAPCAVTACQPFVASPSPSRLPSRPGTALHHRADHPQQPQGSDPPRALHPPAGATFRGEVHLPEGGRLGRDIVFIMGVTCCTNGWVCTGRGA